jgi:hypothetical protein
VRKIFDFHISSGSARDTYPALVSSGNPLLFSRTFETTRKLKGQELEVKTVMDVAMFIWGILLCFVLREIQTTAGMKMVNSTQSPPKTYIIMVASTKEKGDHSAVLLLSTFLLMAGVLLCIYCVCFRDELYSESRRKQPRKTSDIV